MKVKETLLEEMEDVANAKGQKKVLLHEKMMGRKYKEDEKVTE